MLYKKSIIKQLTIILICFVTTSCFTARINPTNYSVSKGKEKVVFKSGARPKWVFERPMFFKNGFFYASGMFTDAPNLGKGLEMAVTLAEAKMMESINKTVESSLVYASTGINVTDTEIAHVVKTTTGLITVQGLTHNKYYYEKKMAPMLAGSGYRYDCYALVELPLAQYQSALVAGIEQNIKSPSWAEQIVGRVLEIEQYPLGYVDTNSSGRSLEGRNPPHEETLLKTEEVTEGQVLPKEDLIKTVRSILKEAP
ncbi:MAG: hypothetical protein HQM16_19410 [Deltaproteobacteria bacterium]|nr:hypothetical protein [Deltaproteobacteria bacterium]